MVPLVKKLLPWSPKVWVTSAGTRYVDVEQLRKSPEVRRTLEVASRELASRGSSDSEVSSSRQVAIERPLREAEAD